MAQQPQRATITGRAAMAQAPRKVLVTARTGGGLNKGNATHTQPHHYNSATYANLVSTYGTNAHNPHCLQGVACTCGATPSPATLAANLAATVRSTAQAMGPKRYAAYLATLPAAQKARMVAALKA